MKKLIFGQPQGIAPTKNIKGFTLVELIIVITILAILATIAFVSFKGFMSDARDANRVSTITNIEKGLQIFQAKSGTLPEPDEKITYTGGTNIVIKQGILSDNVAKILNINTTPKDPLTKNNYYYSISNNGEYYQIGTDKENQTTAGMINTAYADATTSLVRGNYNVDPSLPSLMVVPSSVNTASGIFDPSVCFIMNGGTNTFGSSSGSCIPKSKMTLNTYDKSLVGYWDMESYYQATYSSIPNVMFLKDLSGNNYDLYPRKTTGIFSGISTISGSIFTGSQLGKGIQFDNNNFNYIFQSLDYGNSLSYNNREVRSFDTNFGMNLYSSNSGGKLINGMSFVSIVDFDGIKGINWNNKRVISFGKSNNGLIDSGDVLKGIDSSPFRINNTELLFTNGIHSYITATNNGTAGVLYGSGGLKGCGGFCNSSYSTFKDKNIFNGLNHVVINMDFQSKQNCIYINGIKRSCYNLLDETLQRLQEPGYKISNFYISHMNENFAGIIDDVKIYNRALSDEEIRQQAKIAGF